MKMGTGYYFYNEVDGARRVLFDQIGSNSQRSRRRLLLSPAAFNNTNALANPEPNTQTVCLVGGWSGWGWVGPVPTAVWMEFEVGWVGPRSEYSVENRVGDVR